MKKIVLTILALLPFASVVHAICLIPSLTGTVEKNEADRQAFSACQQKEQYPQKQLQLQQPQGVEQQSNSGTTNFLILDSNMLTKIGTSFQEGQKHLQQLRAEELKIQQIQLPIDNEP